MWSDLANAFKKRIRTGVVTNISHHDTEDFFKDAFKLVGRRLKNALKKNSSVKVNVTYAAEFILPAKDNDDDDDDHEHGQGNTDIKHFTTKNVIINKSTDIEGFLHEQFLDSLLTKVKITGLTNYCIRSNKSLLLLQMEEFQERDSGWAFYKPMNLLVSINQFNPNFMRGGYFTLPKGININAVINVRNRDNLCFLWSILAALYPVEFNKQFCGSYPQMKEANKIFNLEGISFPICLSAIDKFERQNPRLSINVYGFDNGRITPPVHLSKFSGMRDQHVNLLYFDAGVDDKWNVGHYCLITNLSKLTHKQRACHHKVFICDICLLNFTSKHNLNSHMVNCLKQRLNNRNNGDYVPNIKLPAENEVMKFKNLKSLLSVPFVIYADFESLLKKFSTCSPSPQTSFTQPSEKHEPFSIGYQIVSNIENFDSRYETYRGPDPVAWFINQLKNETTFVSNILSDMYKPMTALTSIEIKTHFETNRCPICDCVFTRDNKKVYHHNHFTGKYLCALCNNCNIQCQKTLNTVPVVFHNLSGYDGHFLIPYLNEFDANSSEVKIVPKSSESFISFSKKINNITYKFIDSFRFLSSSLCSLAKNLVSSKLKYISKHFTNPDQRNLACQKCVFPYEYVSEEETLNETQLPSKGMFYNTLTNKHIG